MKLSKSIVALVVGFICGIVVVISCGDQTPTTADASVQQCDCPASEPPLAGRIVRVTNNEQILPMSSDGVGVFCPIGTILLSGGCLARSTDPKYTLNSSNPGPDDDPNPVAWNCRFYNGTSAAVTSTAYATCLKPAP
jgi:hypothetical protein